MIITGEMAGWPALGLKSRERSWANTAYLKRVAGLRTVPVELGRSYMAEDWSQCLISLSTFIDQYITPVSAATTPTTCVASNASVGTSAAGGVAGCDEGAGAAGTPLMLLVRIDCSPAMTPIANAGLNPWTVQRLAWMIVRMPLSASVCVRNHISSRRSQKATVQAR